MSEFRISGGNTIDAAHLHVFVPQGREDGDQKARRWGAAHPQHVSQVASRVDADPIRIGVKLCSVVSTKLPFPYVGTAHCGLDEGEQLCSGCRV